MTKPKASPQKLILISSLAVVMTLLTYLFGAPLIRVLHKAYGSIAYWVTGLLVTGFFVFAQVPVLAITVGSLWLALGVQSELENRGLRWWTSGLMAVVLSTAATLGASFWSLVSLQINSAEKRLELVKEFLKLMSASEMKMEIDPQTILDTAPAIVAVMVIISMGMGMIFEKRTFHLFNLSRQRVAGQINLIEFSLPDAMVWITLTAVLFSVVDLGFEPLRLVAKNVSIVAFTLYFFQGLAVNEVFLTAIRAGVITRALSYFIIVGQLFFVLAIVGFVDYWIDFRRRLRFKEPANRSTK